MAGRFGIDRKRAVRYENDGEGTRLNYEAMDKAVSSVRRAKSAPMMSKELDDADVLGDICEDYARRGRDCKLRIPVCLSTRQEQGKLTHPCMPRASAWAKTR